MKKAFAISVLFVAVLGSSFAGMLDRAWLKGVTDKDPDSYKVGEEIMFTITAEDLDGALPADGFTLDWKRTGDDGATETGKVPFDGKTPFVYRTRIDRPGFVRLEAYVCGSDGERYRQAYAGDTTTPEGRAAMNRFEKRPHYVFFDGGAGAELEKLEAHPEPTDFDAFWARQFARLDRVPMTVRRVPAENPIAGDPSRMEAVEVACAGLRPVTGYLIMPPVEQGKKLPVRLQVFGYDGGLSAHRPPLGRYWKDEIVFEINAHGMPLEELGGTEADLKALRLRVASNGNSYAFDPTENADAETAYFNGMVLRVKRALQFVKTLPEWNGRDLTVSGGSQGGLQAIWAAGCGEGVTFAESYITWCCDMFVNSARGGWYIKWTDALGYYDAVNWARRIPKTCRVDVSRAGLGDYTCPPTGLAKLWNAMTCPKRIVWVQGSQHGYVPPKNYDGRDFMRESAAQP